MWRVQGEYYRDCLSRKKLSDVGGGGGGGGGRGEESLHMSGGGGGGGGSSGLGKSRKGHSGDVNASSSFSSVPVGGVLPRDIENGTAGTFMFSSLTNSIDIYVVLFIG